MQNLDLVKRRGRGRLMVQLIATCIALTSLFLQQEAVDGAGGAGHVGQRDLPQVPRNKKYIISKLAQFW